MPHDPAPRPPGRRATEDAEMDDDFRFLKLDARARFVAAGALFACGFAVGLLSEALTLPGLLVAGLGWIPLMLRRASNRPDDQGLEEWRPVTMAEIDRLDDAIRATLKTRRTLREGLRKVLLVVCFVFLALAVGIFYAAGRHDFGFVLAHAIVFFVPAALFGRIRLHTPKDIAFKMASFRALVSEPLPGGVTITPYLRFDKDSAGRDVPEDIRMMYESRRPLPDFIGIQVQCATNNGPNGAVPYLYAVVLTRGRKGPAHRTAAGLRKGGYETEAGGDDSYGTVVLRQKPSGRGYHTTVGDCTKLGSICGALASALSA